MMSCTGLFYQQDPVDAKPINVLLHTHGVCVFWILLLLFHVVCEITNPLGLSKQINRRLSQFHVG